MLTPLAFIALHLLMVFVAAFLTVKTTPRSESGVRLRFFLGILLSTVVPLGFLQWWVFRNRSPAYAESCMLQALAGIGYVIMASYGLGLI